ncbi:hypothetical protein [Burkholderia ubonensis]|uniref:hypothetical protein n=1 Tax=Burkholderia ubonensis TaxID=101571 RepID=UPI0012FC712B|nr:hypothetical protein [Burkholderia ubonensis]
MAITVYTHAPQTLLNSIRKAIDDKKVETWTYDNDGDFYHTPDQWSKKAWLRPHVQQGVLLLGLLGQEGVAMTKLIYGVYHGRFIEMLLTHFDSDFSNASSTALEGAVDHFK